jgi:predicted nucleotidyltransferase
MNATGREPAEDERLRLIDGLIYADAFDCALTAGEIWRYSRAPIDQGALSRRLREDSCLRELVLARDGLYCFGDRPELIDQRPARIERARRLERRARQVARVLRHTPFVRGLALTGSAAADDAGAGADVDLMVTVARGRLGLVFVLMGSVSRLLGRRLFCPNYYVSEGNLGMAPSTVYIARELAQARDLTGDSRGLWKSNPWLAEIFPNAAPSAAERSSPVRSSLLQRMLEAPLRGSLGARLERYARQLALGRLRVHYREVDEDVPRDVVRAFEEGAGLRFHRGKIDANALARYSVRRTQIAAQLDQAGTRS